MTSTVRLISSMATRTLLADLAALWEGQGGESVACESMGGVDAAKRLAAGEAFDVAVLAADAIERLVDGGHAVAGTRTDLAHSSVAIAARHGETHPSIVDEAALRDAVLAARRVAISTGPSGDAVRRLFARWDIARSLGDRLVVATPGVAVGSLIADGAAELGFQQRSELQGLAGVDILGPMPPGLEITTTFSAACCRTAADPRTVMALLAFWRSPATAAAKRRHGMSPIDD